MPSQSIWDRSALAYDRFERRWRHYGRVAEKLVGPLRIRRGSKILELASGTGACTLILSRKCPEGGVVCLEASAKMIRLAGSNLRDAGCRNVSLIRGDVDRLPIELSRRFDFVVCNSAFWQFADPQGLLRAISKVLKPGGTLAFNLSIWYRTRRGAKEFHRVVDEVLKRHGIDPVNYWGRRKQTNYPALLKSSGFSHVRVTRYSVPLKAAARDEWRRIPAFIDRRRDLAGIPHRVSDEIRQETRKRREFRRPLGAVDYPSWRLITAKNQPQR